VVLSDCRCADISTIMINASRLLLSIRKEISSKSSSAKVAMLDTVAAELFREVNELAVARRFATPVTSLSVPKAPLGGPDRLMSHVESRRRST